MPRAAAAAGGRRAAAAAAAGLTVPQGLGAAAPVRAGRGGWPARGGGWAVPIPVPAAVVWRRAGAAACGGGGWAGGARAALVLKFGVYPGGKAGPTGIFQNAAAAALKPGAKAWRAALFARATASPLFIVPPSAPTTWAGTSGGIGSGGAGGPRDMVVLRARSHEYGRRRFLWHGSDAIRVRRRVVFAGGGRAKPTVSVASTPSPKGARNCLSR